MILVVCEGNVCRSVLAAGLLEASKPLPTNAMEVISRGTHALVDHAADPTIARIGKRLGVDLSAHRAKQLTVEDLSRAKLVLVATREIRSACVRRYPPSIKSIFTIRQLARIIDHGQYGDVEDGEQLNEFVRSVHRRRLSLGTPHTADDIPDPFGQSRRAMESSAKLTTMAIYSIARQFAGSPVEWVPVTTEL